MHRGRRVGRLPTAQTVAAALHLRLLPAYICVLLIVASVNKFEG